MNKKLFNILFPLILLCYSCSQNNTGKKTSNISGDFSLQNSIKLSGGFKLDSLGINGFREKNRIYDTIQKTWLIIGRKLEGYNKEQIIALLGKPNRIGINQSDNSIVMEYYVGKVNERVHKFFQVIFTKNDKVCKVIMFG
ncbi:MAG TPA: hypothetical protein VN922_06140 [Bacteroidia bacterium]|nr:hypothetical protein [Bacteroidia bacterium]